MAFVAVASAASAACVAVHFARDRPHQGRLRDAAGKFLSEDIRRGALDAEVSCGMAKKGDKCYTNVVWAMTSGIRRNPSWYPGLTMKSTFEAFQRHIADTTPESGCPKPCKIEGCETAVWGTKCWSNVQWVLTNGIYAHPDWYPGLSSASPREAIQDNIRAKDSDICPKPACNAQPFTPVTLYCWAVVLPSGYELPLMRAQLARKAGMFQCDDYALISNRDLGMAGARTLVIPNVYVSGVSVSGTSPNAPIFVDALHKIKDEGRYQAHDWVIKVDPDTVLIPDRLRNQLQPENQPQNPYPPPYQPSPSAGTWVPNCDKMVNWGARWGGLWPMMFGSVEIFSRDALNNYFANEWSCKAAYPDWQRMGEDRFLGLCFRKLHARELFMKQGDGNCGPSYCGDGHSGAYHPRKDIGSWMQCWNQATR